MTEALALAVIGGSGLYDFDGLEEIERVAVDTPFGPTSAPIVLGQLHHRRVAFLARHGHGHHLTPTEVPYRANMYALKSLGATRIVSVSACGSLRDELVPGDIVVPDQLVDFTRVRDRTFFGEGIVAHVSTPDPFCPELSSLVLRAVSEERGTVHAGGAFVTIEGPRFSTRAESQLFRGWGMSLIGMTTAPEAFLAREAEMCYAVMAHVTDYDVWHQSEAPVTVEAVLKILRQNTDLAQRAIRRLVLALPETRHCTCPNALAGAIITGTNAISPESRRKLAPILAKYFEK